MNKIVNVKKAIENSNRLRTQGKKIVLVGGCFDILHVGHIRFLTEAKKYGNILVVLLESDQTIQDIKGNQRPIHTQKDRAQVLEALTSVDYIIPLPPRMSDKQYDRLVFLLKPDIIATTRGDPYRIHKERQARLVQGRVIDVIKRIPSKSSSTLAKQLFKEEL